MLGGVIILLCMVGMFFFGRHTAGPAEREVLRVDTVIVHDTIREFYPQEVDRVVVRTKNIEVPVIVRDTVRDTVYVQLPIEERTYQSDEYKAVIEGYDPRLKSMEVYPKTVYRTEVVTKPARWGIGVHVGYGASKQGLSPYVGVGLSYNLLTF